MKGMSKDGPGFSDSASRRKTSLISIDQERNPEGSAHLEEERRRLSLGKAEFQSPVGHQWKCP